MFTCPDGGCLTTYQSATVVKKLLNVMAVPSEVVHGAHHILTEAAEKVLDAVNLNDETIAAGVEAYKKFEEEHPSPVDLHP